MSLEIGENFVGVTNEGVVRTSDSTEALIIWSDNTFVVPLLSLFQQTVKFKLYRELVTISANVNECQGELVGWVQNEELFAKEIWAKPNRSFSF